VTRQTSKSKQEHTDNGVEALREDLNTLREDMSHLVHTVVDLGRNSASSAKDRTSEEFERRVAQLEAAYGKARERGVEYAQSARKSAEQHPLVTLGVAFGVGALIGHLMHRRD